MFTNLHKRRVYYSTAGSKPVADRAAVLFVHGAGMDHTVWTMPARYFTRQGAFVVSPDLPGHGRSEGPGLTSVETMAAWYVSLLQALEVSHASVVGHSMGSLVAMQMAVDAPSLVKRLALFGTSAPMAVSDVLLDAAEDNNHDAFLMANTWSHSAVGQRGGNSNPGLWMMAQGQRLLERMPADVYFNDLSACNSFTNGLSIAGRITCPTLVVIGERDQMTAPSRAAAVAEAISGSVTVRLPGCGHAMMNEQPNAVLDALAGFIPAGS